MKILSIDVDFISDKYADIISGLMVTSPHIQWWHYYKFDKQERSDNLEENYINFAFLMDVFNSCVNLDSKVIFAINHDTILLELDKIDEKIDIINIDHHHDILYKKKEILEVENFDAVNTGTWVWYLHHKNKINSYTWIKNKNSETFDEGLTYSNTPKNYKSYLKDEIPFNIKDIKFDLIFVCLSPCFLIPEHWKYFHILKKMYEEKIGKKIQYIQQIPEIDSRYLDFELYRDKKGLDGK